MNKSEITKILYRLSAAYPAFRATDPETMADLWTEKLSRFPDEVITDAADLLIDESRYFPSLHEMIVKCHQQVGSRYQALQMDHARLRHADTFNEKAWLEVIAGYVRYGFKQDAETARKDMERERDGVTFNKPAWVKEKMRELEKGWSEK